jgi:hypothetical protein
MDCQNSDIQNRQRCYVFAHSLAEYYHATTTNQSVHDRQRRCRSLHRLCRVLLCRDAVTHPIDGMVGAGLRLSAGGLFHAGSTGRCCARLPVGEATRHEAMEGSHLGRRRPRYGAGLVAATALHWTSRRVERPPLVSHHSHHRLRYARRRGWHVHHIHRQEDHPSSAASPTSPTEGSCQPSVSRISDNSGRATVAGVIGCNRSIYLQSHCCRCPLLAVQSLR